MSAPVVLVTCRQMQLELPKYRDRLESLGYAVIVPDLDGRQQFTARELLDAGGPELVGIIAGDDELSRSFIEGAPNLKSIVRWGIGTDSVDFDAAREHGVAVRNTPGVFSDEVADAAMSFVLALARGTVEVDSAVRSGGWPKWEGVTLSGTTMGIVGYGSIGRAVARRARAFGMSVIASDPYAESDGLADLVPIADLLRQSRFVVLAAPLNAETQHLMNQERLAMMQPDGYLINVARGAIIDEAALVDALSANKLAGAAFDVYETEPLPRASALRHLPGVILGAHNGSNTREAVVRASEAAIEYLIEELHA